MDQTQEAEGMERLHQQRLKRYVAAMRNEKPDRIPIRPFVAEFTGTYAGYTCQELAHDYTKAFDAAVKCARDFDWDAVVPNMVYVWTGLAQAAGLRYYGIPGIHIPHTTGFNYIEPPEDQAWMRADEYDALIDDPTGFLYSVWLPRVSTEINRLGEPASYRSHRALVKSAMAMLQYFYAFGPQIERLRRECGVVSAIAGIFKAPFDILADKLRGYVGLVMDMATQPKKVLQACEALMPHLCHVGLSTADPSKQVPIGFWMHRGCVPFINPRQFESHYWPTLKPIIEAFWKHGHQTLFYAEGRWARHFGAFRQLPPASIVFHCDQDDIFQAHRELHDRFALSGGIPNFLLSYGKAKEVREFCLRVINEVAAEGGYIMDAGAIMQDDTRVANLREMTEVCREHGVYCSPACHPHPDPLPKGEGREKGVVPKGEEGGWAQAEARGCGENGELTGMTGRAPPRIPSGVCEPWEERLKELPALTGDKDLLRQVWTNIEGLANTYIWQLLLSF